MLLAIRNATGDISTVVTALVAALLAGGFTLWWALLAFGNRRFVTTPVGAPAERSTVRDLLDRSRAKGRNQATGQSRLAPEPPPGPQAGDLRSNDLPDPPPAAESPTELVVGEDSSGDQVRIDLAEIGGLSLYGPGAAVAFPAMFMSKVVEQATIVIPEADLDVAQKGMPDEGECELRLWLTPDLGSALTEVQALITERIRRAEDTEAHGDIGNTLSAIVLCARLDTAYQQQIRAVLEQGAQHGVCGLFYGDWPYGLSGHVGSRGTLSQLTGPGAERLNGVTLYALRDSHGWNRILERVPCRASVDSAECGESTAEEKVGQPEVPTNLATDGKAPRSLPAFVREQRLGVAEPEPARSLVVVTGPFEISRGDRTYSGRAKQATADLAGYLAWHEWCADSRKVSSELWTYSTRKAGGVPSQFGNAVSGLRKALREVSDEHAQGEGDPRRYLDRDRLGRWGYLPGEAEPDVKLIRQALEEATVVASDQARLAALECGVALYRGEYTPGAKGPWAEAIRAELQGDIVRALCRIADLCVDDDPEHAMRSLDRAIKFDDCAQDAWLRLIATLERQGRADDARDACRTLSGRLAEQGKEPSLQISESLQRLTKSSPEEHLRP